jgi:hypothetical protein
MRQQYDQMIKYTTALRLGTAETEAILRRFTKKNVQHPTYKALAELGKAIKTIFLCRYITLEVEDARETEKRLKERGVTISDPVKLYEEKFWVGGFLDSEGNKIWFSSYA